jgi:hypothetical protein
MCKTMPTKWHIKTNIFISIARVSHYIQSNKKLCIIPISIFWPKTRSSIPIAKPPNNETNHILYNAGPIALRMHILTPRSTKLNRKFKQSNVCGTHSLYLLPSDGALGSASPLLGILVHKLPTCNKKASKSSNNAMNSAEPDRGPPRH